MKPERQEALRRFFALPLKEQLAAFKEMGDYLAEEHGVEPEIDRAIVAKQEALAALTTVHERLVKEGVLVAGEPLTGPLYDRGARELGLSVTRSSIIRVFGSWRNAAKAVGGDHVPESALQRRHRLRVAGRRRSHEGYLAALRSWLETDPKELGRRDFDAFVETQNARSGSGSVPMPRASATASGLGVPWQACIAVARGETSLEEARDATIERAVAGLGDEDLVGITVVAAIADVRSQHVGKLVSTGRLAPPAALVSGRQGWMLGDARRCQAGLAPVKRAEYERQDRVFDSRQLATELHLRFDHLRTLMSEKRWDRVPLPHGRVGQQHYWRREDVSRWMKERNAKSAREKGDGARL